MVATHSVQVSNLSANTSQKSLSEFFAFCGKIADVSITEGPPKSATVAFEKPSAAKTALMLNGGSLDGEVISVTSETEHEDTHTGSTEEPLRQEDKPRAGIAAEYLARGYVLSDHILQRAIDMDQKQGISQKFLTYIKGVDSKAGERIVGPEKTISGHAYDTAKALDEKHGITKTATDYYEKIIGTTFGQRALSFYTSTSKQVLDIHEEAKRIAETQKKPAAPGEAAATPAPASATSEKPASA